MCTVVWWTMQYRSSENNCTGSTGCEMQACCSRMSPHSKLGMSFKQYRTTVVVCIAASESSMGLPALLCSADLSTVKARSAVEKYV